MKSADKIAGILKSIQGRKWRERMLERMQERIRESEGTDAQKAKASKILDVADGAASLDLEIEWLNVQREIARVLEKKTGINIDL